MANCGRGWPRRPVPRRRRHKVSPRLSSLTIDAKITRKSIVASAPNPSATPGQALHVGFDHFHRLLLHGANGSRHHRVLRNDVIGIAGLNPGDAQHRGVARGDVAGHDRLQRGAQMAGDQNGIDTLLRMRTVRAFAGDRMSKNAPPAARAPGPVMNFPTGRPGRLCMPYTALHGNRSNKPVLQHGQRAADALFGRLKNEIDGAVEVACLRQVFRRAQQHRRVPVMAAGVHAAGFLLSCGKLVASKIGSASMSARNPTEAWPLPFRNTPTTPVTPTPRCTSMPHSSSFFATRSAVRTSCNPSSGCAWIS